MDLQKLINAMNDQNCRTRSDYHLTLGDLRNDLATAPDDLPVVYDDGMGAGGFDSYRGYYTDIAIGDGPAKLVSVWREKVAEALNTTFEGYKGGDYPASPDKPLWRAEYGSWSSVAIVATAVRDGAFVLVTKQVD